MKNQLIFGGSGLLGSNYNILNKDLNIYNFFFKRKVPNPLKIKFNILNLKKFIKKKKIKLIINFAAITNIEDCETKKNLAFKTNVILPEKLSILSKDLKIKFLHISTDHYIAKKKIKEKTKVKTCNYYSKNKLLAEKKILYHNKNAIILRTNFLKSHSAQKSFFEKIEKSLKSNKKIYLFNDVYFNPVSIRFLINVIKNLLNKDARGIYNVSSDKCITKYDLGIMIAKKINCSNKSIIKSSVSSRRDLVARPKKMCLDNTKLKKFLKIKKIDLFENL